jgi:hypothetical protein
VFSVSSNSSWWVLREVLFGGIDQHRSGDPRSKYLKCRVKFGEFSRKFIAELVSKAAQPRTLWWGEPPQLHTHIRTHTFTHTHAHTTHAHTHVRTHVHTHVHTTRAHTHTHTCTRTRTYTRTFVQHVHNARASTHSQRKSPDWSNN